MIPQTLDLLVTTCGPFHLAFSSDQIAWVAPCPPDLEWPSPDGVLGWLPFSDRTGAPALRAPIIDPVVRWHELASTGRMRRFSPTARPLPPVMLVVNHGLAALAVDSYALRSCQVQPAPAALRGCGIHAVFVEGEETALVLDLAYIIHPQRAVRAVERQVA